MEAFLARLGNLCWWTSCAVNVLWAAYVLWISTMFREPPSGLLLAWVLIVMAIISAIGLGLRYLFAGKLFA